MTEPRIRYDILANAQGEEDVRRLAAELEKLDDAVDPAAAERARALAERLRELGEQQAAIRSFVELKKETGDARQRLDEAQQAAQKLGQELAQTEKPTRAQVGQFEKLKDAVKQSEQELQTKTRALGDARARLGELGVSTEGLAGKERDLRQATAEVRGEIAQLGQQGQAVQRFTELAQATEKARRELQQADTAVEAYRQEITQAGEPTASQARRLAELEKSASGAQQAFQSASQTQAQAASTLRAAGVDVDRLTAAQGKLAPTQRQVAQETQGATTALQANAGALGSVAGSSETAAASLSNVKVQVAAAGAAVIGLQQVLGRAAQASSQFQTALAEVSTLLDDTADIDALGRAVEELTLKFGGSAPDQARALYQIISAGATDAAQAVELLDAANTLAIGGVTDVKTAAEGLVGALNAYGPAAGSARDVSDALFVAMKAGRTTVGELSANIGQVAPIAAQAGVSLEELLAGAAALTTVSGNTSQAMTQLRAIINAVIKPSGDAAKLAKELGLEFNAQALQAKGLAGFLEDVRAKTAGNTEVNARLFGSVEALNGVLSLTGAQAGTFSGTLDNMAQRAGATAEAFGKFSDTPAQAAARFGAAIEQLQRNLGQAVTSFTPLLDAASRAVTLFNDLPGPIRTGTVAVGALAVSLPTLAVALAATRSALTATAAAFGAKATAAAATVAPLAAASAGTTAMGAASAAATPAIAGAAVATTALGRALTLLRGALGIGIVVSVVELASSFFRARREAESLRAATEQTQAALRALADTPAPQALDKVTQAQLRTAASAAQARDALADQDKAAREAAKALGVDLYKASNLINEEFARQLDQLSALVRGLDTLKRSGVDTGAAVQAALEKMISGARNQAELDTLRNRIEALGKAGVVSEEQVRRLMTTLQEQARKASAEVNALAEAYTRFGLTSQAELQQTADQNRRAWELIKNDATASLDIKRQAFLRYAETAIRANGGVADASLRAQARALGLGDAFAQAGAKTQSAMAAARGATEQLASAANTAATNINRVADAAQRLAGVRSVLTGADNPFTQAGLVAREQRMAGNALRSDFSITQRSGTIGSVYTPPPGNPADYEWRSSPSRPGGYWELTPAASQRIREEERARRGLPPGGVGPFGGSLTPQEIQQRVSSGAAAAAGAGQASQAGPSQVVEIRFPVPGGGFVGATVANQAQADALVRLLQEQYRQAGGGG